MVVCLRPANASLLWQEEYGAEEEVTNCGRECERPVKQERQPCRKSFACFRGYVCLVRWYLTLLNSKSLCYCSLTLLLRRKAACYCSALIVVKEVEHPAPIDPIETPIGFSAWFELLLCAPATRPHILHLGSHLEEQVGMHCTSSLPTITYHNPQRHDVCSVCPAVCRDGGT